MLTGQAKRDYQHKYMTGYMRNYRKNKPSSKSSQKQTIKNALQSPQISASELVKVFTGSLQNQGKVFTKPARKTGEGDNQYNYRCFRAEQEANMS